MRRLITGLTAVLVMLVPQSMPALASVPMEPAADQVLTWTAGNSVTAYTTAPTQAVAGLTTIVFENSEATGNTTDMSHTLTFDRSTPGYNHDVDLNVLAYPDDGSNGRHSVEVTLTPGKYRYFCAIPGHGTMVGEFTVSDDGEDTVPPTVTAAVSGPQNPDGHYLGQATVTVTAEDAQSGVASVEYELDDTGFKPYTAPVVVSAIGDHTVQYRATDHDGNVSPTGSVGFRLVDPPEDTTAPTVTAAVSGEQDADGNYLGTARVTVTATDAGSGVASVEYQVDGGAWTAYTVPIAVATNGAHTVAYRAADAAGNVSAVGTVTFTVVPSDGDGTPPAVSGWLTGNQNARWEFVDRATLNAQATDAGGVRSIEYALDGGAWTAYTAPVLITAAGAHTVKVRATDNAGNVSAELSGTFTIVKAASKRLHLVHQALH